MIYLGIFKAAPSLMFVPFSPLAALIFSTVVPYFLARLQRESPDFTTCLELLPPEDFLAVEVEELPEVDFLGGLEAVFFRLLEDELVVRRGGGSSSSSWCDRLLR